jgi:hypothetical protein
MPRVGFEPMTPVFERETTVHILDGAATVIAIMNIRCEFLIVCHNFTESDRRDWSCKP